MLFLFLWLSACWLRITDNRTCICASNKADADQLESLVGETELGVGYAESFPKDGWETEFGVGSCFEMRRSPTCWHCSLLCVLTDALLSVVDQFITPREPGLLTWLGRQPVRP